MLIFPHGLLQRKHEFLLTVQVEVDVPGREEPDILNHVLHNHANPLQCLPKEMDFIITDLVDKLKKQGLKPKEVICVDLGPMKSAFNWENKRKFLPHGQH